jgi:F-type H+-transporting ATPase subunit b
MGFDGSTFVLEIANFLILVWILTHYFYRPVAAVIERRRSTIEERIQQAEQLHENADAMRRQYETRLAEWEAEKRQAREIWNSELAAERTRELEAFREVLAAERQRSDVLEQRRLRARESELEQHAVQLAGRFAAKLLDRFASPALQINLIDLFLDDLARIPDEQWRLLESNGAGVPVEGVVTTAFPLDESSRSRLETAFAEQLGRPLIWRYIEDKSLIAGLSVELGPLALRANLRDELKWFSEAD